MKAEIKNGYVVLFAETDSESAVLLAFSRHQVNPKIENSPESKKRRMGYKKICPECKIVCKNSVGLAVHRRRMHGIKGKTYHITKRYRDRQEAQKVSINVIK